MVNDLLLCAAILHQHTGWSVLNLTMPVRRRRRLTASAALAVGLWAAFARGNRASSRMMGTIMSLQRAKQVESDLNSCKPRRQIRCSHPFRTR